jgi:hypothetical protein
MEQEIVDTALESLHRITGIQSYWTQEGPLDGGLNILYGGKQYAFTVEVKSELRSHQTTYLEDYDKHYDNFLLIARRLFPRIKETLRHSGIAYLETNGNIFLQKDGLYLFVDSQSPVKPEKTKSNRAFTKTGLKVVFHLLQNKDAINLTQRELAGKTNVGLGNIPQVIEGLKETGYLISLNPKTYLWENRSALLERWVAEYATTLRPKLQKERYTFKGDWRGILLNSEKTVWGGEPAADLLTDHLRPERFIIYTRKIEGI